MISKLFHTLILVSLLSSCHGQNNTASSYADAEPIQIHRFDKSLYQLIDAADSSQLPQLQQQYAAMLDILGKGLFNLQQTNGPELWAHLQRLYTEPTLKKLYLDAITQYDSLNDIQQQLGCAFAFLKANLPSMQIPAIYMHVSGLNQNVLTADSLLSLSIDKYMGMDYPLYQSFFYDYQRQKMQRENIAPDYLAGWLMTEFPFKGKENVLLDRMIYEGKIRYILSKALPETSPATLLGYSTQGYEWVQAHEAKIWETIIKRKHLYTPEIMTTAHYFEDAPSTFLATDEPGNIGSWMGWQIISAYMKETGSSLQALMDNQDAQEILAQSKYKP